MTRNQLESIAGKLQAVSDCIRPARIFVARLFNKIPKMSRGRLYVVDMETVKDLRWWRKFLPIYNSTAVMWLEVISQPDAIISTDTCLTGVGEFK